MMGCCFSRTSKTRANQLSRWRSTGIVGLRASKLKEFPNEVLDLNKCVRTLDLTNNKLAFLPMEIGNFTAMQRLFLADNVIERLPVAMGNLASLRFLILDGNRMTTLPDELGTLSKLEQLSVKGNMLMRLPVTIGGLRNLQLLNVSDNKLKSLPETIGSCGSLEELQASGNFIEALPPSVCNLVYMKSLILSNNNINELPLKLLKDCRALQNISLYGNPIQSEQFQQMEGFLDFESRRKKKFDKQIDSNVMMSSTALDLGVDLR